MKKSMFFVILAIATTVCISSCMKNNEPASILTLEVTDTTTTTAKSGGKITNDGGGIIKSKGIVWNTTEYPTVEQHAGITNEGAGTDEFQSLLTGLKQSTVYYVRAYTKSSAEISYGNQIMFNTLGAPISAFSAKPTSGYFPFTVNFKDESIINPSSWHWNFCDSTISTHRFPKKIYQQIGEYTVTLTTSNSYGSSTHTKTDYIAVKTFSGGETGEPCQNIPTVIDIDGNVYKTIQIGNQCWMKENLKTTKYRNGAPIEYYGTFDHGSLWRDNSDGIYTWHSKNITWKDIYGALYNWHAVNNTNGICPKGWHVPSKIEWNQLANYIASQGYLNSNSAENPNTAGNALRTCRQINSPFGGDCETTEHPRWKEHNYNRGFDEYGFFAVPGSYVTRVGGYSELGEDAYWWSSSEYSDARATAREIKFNSGILNNWQMEKEYGFSVRCIKD